MIHLIYNGGDRTEDKLAEMKLISDDNRTLRISIQNFTEIKGGYTGCYGLWAALGPSGLIPGLGSYSTNSLQGFGTANATRLKVKWI